MRNGFKVIDADAHFYEPADLSPYSSKCSLTSLGASGSVQSP